MLRSWNADAFHAPGLRRCLADTVAMVVCPTAPGACAEIVVAGLTPWQSARVRAAAVPAMLSRSCC